MLIPRVFPVLLVDNNRLINTERFKESRYLGDPLNAIRIYNEKQIDELVLYDISRCDSPPWDLLTKVSQVSRMPLTYGGHIKSAEQAKKIISLGFEKVSIASSFLINNNIINEIADEVGSQSAVVTLNVTFNRIRNSYRVFSHKTPKHTYALDKVLKFLENADYGELVINNKDLDGTRKGYDTKLVEYIRERTSKVITIAGGCNSVNNIVEVNKKYKDIGFGVTSVFVYYGNLDAVLINYDHPFRPETFKEKRNDNNV